MPRAVVDVNVLVSALLHTDGTPVQVVRSWLAGAFELIVSERLLVEFAQVIERPRLARRIDPLAVDALVAALQVEGLLIEDPPAERVVEADPNDDYLIALARAGGGAHAIVTGDSHLLELEGLDPPALTPRAFLAWLERIG